MQLAYKILDSVFAVEEGQWNRLLTQGDSPFQSWGYLAALERSGCATQEHGWTPYHLAAYQDETLVGVLPLFVKTHSYGEFIFDFAWADAAHRCGLNYYPKMVSMVPFTPVAGRGILVSGLVEDPECILLGLAKEALRMSQDLNLSSLHLLYLSDAESDALESTRLLRRATFQYQWVNEGYDDFSDYLGRFRSKRRAQIRRERRELRQSGVVTRLISGADASDSEIETMWTLYASTVDQFGFSQRYLNRAFFFDVCKQLGDTVQLLFAYEANSPIGGTFNLVDNGVFYGRYWGALSQRPYLHFEVCYYRPIELAIERGWHRVEAGAGGQHKMGRGFLPRVIHSAHVLHHPMLHQAVGQFLSQERVEILSALEKASDWVFKT